MNILPDGTGWILPPRCAARYTLGVLWRYGVTNISYHEMDPEAPVTKIVMNVRNPYTRLRSWLRLWNTTLSPTVSSQAYIENLHTLEWSLIKIVTKIENPNGLNHLWKYPMPLNRYRAILKDYGKEIDFLVRNEHYEEDMTAADYPTLDYKYTAKEFKPANGVKIGFHVQEENTKWEASDGQSDLEFYQDNPYCAEIVRTYYADDFKWFGYSLDPADMKS